MVYSTAVELLVLNVKGLVIYFIYAYRRLQQGQGPVKDGNHARERWQLKTDQNGVGVWPNAS